MIFRYLILMFFIYDAVHGFINLNKIHIIHYFDNYILKYGLIVGILLYITICYFKLVSKPIVLNGNNAKISNIMKECKSVHKLFWPTPYCFNEHIQLVPFIFIGLFNQLIHPFKWYHDLIELDDGETIILDWVISSPKLVNGLTIDQDDMTPILMLQHGAFCNSTDLPGQSYIQPAIDRGWIICVLNRRGHNQLLSKPKFNFFGCIHDIKSINKYILSKRPKTKILTIGLSSGSGLVANALGQDDSLNDFYAGVGICPGYDITKCMTRFTSPYKEFLLSKGKEYFLKQNESLLKDIKGYKECLNANDLQEWLDNTYAMSGCSSKDDYYNNYNPMNFIPNIKKPCLFINSENDPLCTIENFNDSKEYISSLDTCTSIVITKTGSHCPFYEGMFMQCWTEKVAFEFFDEVLKANYTAQVQ